MSKISASKLAWLPVFVWVISLPIMFALFFVEKDSLNIFEAVLMNNPPLLFSESIYLNKLAFLYYLSLHVVTCRTLINKGSYWPLVNVTAAFIIWLLLHIGLKVIFHVPMALG